MEILLDSEVHPGRSYLLFINLIVDAGITYDNFLCSNVAELVKIYFQFSKEENSI